MDLYFVKLIIWKVSNISLENILADDPLPRMSKKGSIFDRRGSTVHEWTTLVTIVSYKYNDAAKRGSSKPLTTIELWLLELWIKSTRILAPIPDAL